MMTSAQLLEEIRHETNIKRLAGKIYRKDPPMVKPVWEKGKTRKKKNVKDFEKESLRDFRLVTRCSDPLNHVMPCLL